jgi:hypothetical protein
MATSEVLSHIWLEVASLICSDDTVLFLDLDDQSISSLKFLLYCYEAMSRMKINFQKSEIFVFAVDLEEQGEWLTSLIAA